MRIIGGDANSGRVEIKYEGLWTTLCGQYDFGTDEARVVCRMLGKIPLETIIIP